MKKFLVGVILGLTLNGCATHGKYTQLLDTWVGATENELVNSWGPPLGSYVKDDGSKVLTYQESGSYPLPGVSVLDPISGFPNTTAGPTVITSCRTRFYISSSGIIDTWDWEGNSCTSAAKIETPLKKIAGTPPSNIDDEQVKQLKSLLESGIMNQKEFDEAMQAIK